MLYKRCSVCRKRIPINGSCKCDKNEKAKVKAGNKQIHDDFYKTREWQHIREQAIAKFFGLDIYSLLVSKKIEYGQTVHHIFPIEDDFYKRCDINNLIYLTEANHRNVHALYKNGAKIATQEFLLKLIADFERFIGGNRKCFEILLIDRSPKKDYTKFPIKISEVT